MSGSRPATILRKALAIAADPRAPAGERDSASRRVAEILAKHPELAAELHRGGEAPRPGLAAKVPRPPPGKGRARKGKQAAPASDGAAAAEAVREVVEKMDARSVRKVTRVVGKAAGMLGLKRVQTGAAGIIGLLDEWERGG